MTIREDSNMMVNDSSIILYVKKEQKELQLQWMDMENTETWFINFLLDLHFFLLGGKSGLRFVLSSSTSIKQKLKKPCM